MLLRGAFWAHDASKMATLGASLLLNIFQKNPRVQKNSCPRFWGRKWLRQFYGHLEKCVLCAGKPMSIKFRVLGVGGVFWVWGGGGGKCRFYFYGREDFSEFYSVSDLRRACFCQARVAQAVLPPGALFHAGGSALPPCAPKSHMRPLPYLGLPI